MFELHTVVLAPDPRSVLASREAIMRVRPWLGPRTDDASLLAGTLVSTALRHGRGELELSIRANDRAARLTVAAAGSWTLGLCAGGVDADTLDQVADRWGVGDDGAHAWFELDL